MLDPCERLRVPARAAYAFGLRAPKLQRRCHEMEREILVESGCPLRAKTSEQSLLIQNKPRVLSNLV
jgi:hypothetical protein